MYIYICVCVCVCMHECIYACIYMYMHMCMVSYAHTHTHTHTHSRLLSLYIHFRPPSPFCAIVSRIPLHHLILSVAFFISPDGTHSASLWDIYIYSATLHSVWVLSVSEVFSACREQNSLHLLFF